MESLESRNSVQCYAESPTSKLMSFLTGIFPDTDPDLFSQMLEHGPDVELITQQIRLCRLKLGSVLNRLENYTPGPDAVKLIRDRSDEVSNEIRLMSETIQRLMGH